MARSGSHPVASFTATDDPPPPAKPTTFNCWPRSWEPSAMGRPLLPHREPVRRVEALVADQANPGLAALDDRRLDLGDDHHRALGERQFLRALRLGDVDHFAGVALTHA